MEDSNTNNPTLSEQKRTTAQNRALHAWFGMVAEVLNHEGTTMNLILNKFIVDAPVTKNSVKELIWKPLQNALYDKKSTTELLKREEIDKIYDTLNKFFAEELQVEIPPFPSEELRSLDEIKGY